MPAWSGRHELTRVLFRALGLSVFISTYRSLQRLTVGKGDTEPTKIAIRKSRMIALTRASIHIVPVSVALWEIAINCNTYYLGATVRNLAYYQFGAKVHEMAAQASLAAVIFSWIRYEISLGKGLPFGALFSALQVSQASYLWSMEFWGSITSKHLSLRHRIGMILVISTAIVLAATVGPSSAILLIPRLDYWPAGDTQIWLNATSQDLWPDRTNGSLVSPECQISDPLLVANDCPSSGWQAIETYLSFTYSLIPPEYVLRYNFLESPAYVELTSANSLRRLYINDQTSLVRKQGFDDVLAVATTQQAAVADALTTVAALWSLALTNVTTKGHGSVLTQLDAVHSITTDYYQPYTVVSCESDIIYGPDDSKPLFFPLPPGSTAQMLNTSALNDSVLFIENRAFDAFEYTGITRSEILKTPGSVSENRLRWIELPQDPFNGTAIGAVILLPRESTNTTQEVLMCNLGAGWGTSKLNTSTFAGSSQTVLSEVGLDPTTDGYSRLIYAGSRDFQNSGSVNQENLVEFLEYFALPMFPQRPIIATEDWARYLNPSLANSNTTVFDRLMGQDYALLDVSVKAKIVLTCLLANGLSRIGSTAKLQGSLKTAVQHDGSLGLDGNHWFSGKGDAFTVDAAPDWVKLRVSSNFEGYAYNTRGAPPKVAICFLLTYCVVALSHVLYSGITGISSTCWDSIGEVTALAVNSPPTVLLRNSCAGITELNIFKLPVRVLATRDDEHSDGEHLELVFGDVDEKVSQRTVIEENRVYGTMPLLALERKEKVL